MEFATLAHTYSGSNPSNWLMSRKLNGWGCVWDGGITRGMWAAKVPWYYRGGDKPGQICTGLWTIGRNNKPKIIHAPGWWLDDLPVAVPLQGELWYDDNLSFVKEVAGRKIPDERWAKLKLMWYNVKPYSTFTGLDSIADLRRNDFYKNMIWSSRMHLAEPYIKSDRIVTVGHTEVSGKEHLNLAFNDAMKNQWEGLMLVNPYSRYELKRSYYLLKIKKQYDMEVTVVGYVEGRTGKNLGRIGSIRCGVNLPETVKNIPNGARYVGQYKVFSVSGLTDEEHENAKDIYPLGYKLPITFLGISNHGVPVHCNIKRI